VEKKSFMTFAWNQPCPRSLKKFFEKTAVDTPDGDKPKKEKKNKDKKKDKDNKEKRKPRDTDAAAEPPSKSRKTRK